MFESDATAPAVAEAPADAPPPVEEQTLAPIDGEARAAEASRGRMRRAKEKLKKAKTEKQLREIAREISADEAGDGETKAEAEAATADTPAEPKALEPTADQVKAARALVQEVCAAAGQTIALVPAMAAGRLEAMDEQRRFLVLITCTGAGAALQKDAGEKLAAAWAPILAKYMPKVANASPWGKAFAGTYAAAVSIGASIQAEAEKFKTAALAGAPPPPPPAQAVPSPAQVSP